MDSLDNPTLTPGVILRQQRQRIGWSVDDIANALCLSAELIDDLEQDNFTDMGGSTFVLGYLRSYARMVNVDIESAISNVRDKIPEYIPDPEHIPGSKQSTKERTPRSSLDTALFFIGILIACGIFYFLISEFWISKGSDVINDDLLVEIPDHGDDASDNVSNSRNALVQAPTLQDLVDAMTAENDIPINLALRQLRNSNQTESIIASRNSTNTQNTAINRLVLIFDEGSWVDVKDNSGLRLLSQIVSAGNTIELNGVPPFTVFLGNSAGVRVQYLGKIESYSQSKKGLFARFVVGEQP